jgi:hypothetical protein
MTLGLRTGYVATRDRKVIPLASYLGSTRSLRLAMHMSPHGFPRSRSLVRSIFSRQRGRSIRQDVRATFLAFGLDPALMYSARQLPLGSRRVVTNIDAWSAICQDLCFNCRL